MPSRSPTHASGGANRARTEGQPVDEPLISIPRQRGHRELVADLTGDDVVTVEIVLSGSLGATAAEYLVGRLIGPTDARGNQVRLNLLGLTSISFPAQVMVLRLARLLRRRGGGLEIYGPNDAVRAQCRQLDLFGRVRTIDAGTPTR